jgi:hypothetical protein
MRDAIILISALIILYSFVLVEIFIVLYAIRLSRINPRLGHRWFESAERWFGRLADRRGLSVAMVGVSVLAGRAALAPFLPRHQPVVTDEFSYLLASDTFASGRLTNPTHPLWRHFESMHIIQKPTYASMYQPAQGLALAAGQKIAGNPWIGVYLSMALMCAACCWMLQGWLPPRWALLGALLLVMRLALFGYWMNSFWGGAPAALGGALVLGAMPRLRKYWRARDALALAIGVAILVASRPYEGFLTCAPVFVMLLVWITSRKIRPAQYLRVALPVGVTLIVTALAMGHYFSRVTGNPFRMPQLVQRETYAIAPYFIWQTPAAEHPYRHKPIHDFFAVWEMQEFLPSHSAAGLVLKALEKIGSVLLFFLGPVLCVPLVFFPDLLHDRRIRPLLIVGLCAAVGMGVNAWFYAHYAAPVTALLFVVVVQGIRHLRVWRRRTGAGLFLARAIPAICVLMIVLRVAAQPLGVLFPPAWPMTWYHTPEGNVARARVLTDLSAMDGKQLAIVRYRPDHRAVMNEWVYNRADIDAAKVVWAREMDTAENRELLQYFHDRRAWLVEADEAPPKVSPYPVQP